MNKKKVNIVYEGMMICLVVISLVAMMTNADSNFQYLHQVIWVIFLVDVVIRFIRAAVKWKYIRDNPFDIVTVLPLEDMMLLARFARFLRVFRYKNLVKRYTDTIARKTEQVGFQRITIMVIVVNGLIAWWVKYTSGYTYVESSMWVWGNFLKFDFEVGEIGLPYLSILLKVVGLVYMGYVISKGMTIAKQVYDKWLAERVQGMIAKLRKRWESRKDERLGTIYINEILPVFHGRAEITNKNVWVVHKIIDGNIVEVHDIESKNRTKVVDITREERVTKNGEEIKVRSVRELRNYPCTDEKEGYKRGQNYFF